MHYGDNKTKYIRWAILALLVVGACVLQNASGGLLEIFGARVFLLIPVCVSVAMFEREVTSAIIGAFESGTREYGYVSGDSKLYKSGLCKLSGLDSSTSVVGGGIVCTSGAGGVFPNGFIIGEVKAVHSDDVSSAYYAEIKPFINPDEITDVFVITSFEGQGEGEIKD